MSKLEASSAPSSSHHVRIIVAHALFTHVVVHCAEGLHFSAFHLQYSTVVPNYSAFIQAHANHMASPAAGAVKREMKRVVLSTEL